MNYRSNSAYEHLHGNYSSLDNVKASTIQDSASPRSKMIANTSNTSEFHSIPTAMTVSPSGERITCSLESLEKNSKIDETNPFFNCIPHDSKLDDNFLQKLPFKDEKFRYRNRRKNQAKDRRKVDKIILTQKSFMTARRSKCAAAAVQTDPSMDLITYPESIGDGRRNSQSCMDLTSSTTMEVMSLDNQPNLQYLSESQRKFLSFLLMVILIFWLTSIILDVEIPAEFCRIALNYFWSIKSTFYNQEKPLTFVEKCWKYIKNILEKLINV